MKRHAAVLWVLSPALVVAAVAAGSALAQSPEPSRVPVHGTPEMRRAAGLVLATDPAFADLPSLEEARAEVKVTRSSWYSLRETLTGSILVEINLVGGDCGVTPSGRTWPCEWRHDYLYRVTPGGEVALLFDEGDPSAARPGQPGPSPSAATPGVATPPADDLGRGLVTHALTSLDSLRSAHVTVDLWTAATDAATGASRADEQTSLTGDVDMAAREGHLGGWTTTLVDGIRYRRWNEAWALADGSSPSGVRVHVDQEGTDPSPFSRPTFMPADPAADPFAALRGLLSGLRSRLDAGEWTIDARGSRPCGDTRCTRLRVTDECGATTDLLIDPETGRLHEVDRETHEDAGASHPGVQLDSSVVVTLSGWDKPIPALDPAAIRDHPLPWGPSPAASPS
jgi:hypothetical protein